jgi:atypical dual specificity phosphatase
MNYVQILSNLYIGTSPKTPANIDALLAQLRITAVINMQTPSEMRTANYNWNDVRTHYAIRGIRLAHLPVQDGNTAALHRRLADCVHILETLIHSGHTVYIHCTDSGYNSPTLVLAYLHWICDWPLDKAMDRLAAHPDCRPDLDVVRQGKVVHTAATVA